MKTTEIFIEQVIIGFIVLAICLLPVHSAIESYGSGKDIFVTVAAVGVAYLLGIIFDRYADGCVQRYEQHLRARCAIELSPLPEEPADPFPEDRYRIQQLSAGSGLTEWFNYLRSTIRLSRALAVFVPGLTLAGVMATRNWPNFDGTAAWGYYVLAATYLGLPVISAVIGKSLFGSHVAPRTDAREKMKEYRVNRGLGKGADEPRCAHLFRQLMDLVWSPSMIGGVLIFAAAAVQAAGASPHRKLALVLTACGLAFTILSAWAWARMQKTFMQYLHLSNKHGAAGAASATIDASGPVSPRDDASAGAGHASPGR
jgi:hypothetical protein